MAPEVSRRRIRERPHIPGVELKYRGFKTDMREFESMDFLQQLRYSFQISVDTSYDIQERRTIRTKAVLKTLETDTMERAEKDVRIIAIADIDERRRVRTEFPEFSMYFVYVSYPTDTDKNTQSSLATHQELQDELPDGSRSKKAKNYKFVSTSNHLLQDELPEKADVGEIVNNHADDIRDESLYEKHKRLILEIKAIDADIYRRKQGIPLRRKLTDKELYTWKQWRIMEYLETSLELQDEYPEIALDYFSVNTDETGRTRLALRSLTDKYFHERLGNPSAGSELRNSDIEASTGLPLEDLLRTYRRYIQDPSSISDDAEISVGICRMLGLSARQKETSATPIATEAVPDEIVTGKIEPAGEERVAIQEDTTAGDDEGMVQEVIAVTHDAQSDDEDGATILYQAADQKKTKIVLSNAERKKRRKKFAKEKNWQSSNTDPSPSEEAVVAQATTSRSTKIRGPALASDMVTVSYAELAARYGVTLPTTPVEEENFNTSVTKFIDVFTTTKGLEVPYLRQLQFIRYLDNINPEMARSKAAGFINDVIRLPAQKRQELGIYAIAVGDVTTEDPLYESFPQVHQYKVNLIFSENGEVQMVSADRGDLIKRSTWRINKTLKLLDNQVATTVDIIQESPIDSYQRLQAEIKQVDALLEEQRRQIKLHSYGVMGDVPGRVEKERAILAGVTALTDVKKAIVLKTLHAAEQLQATLGNDSLYLLREGESESNLFLSLQELEETNRALRLLGVQQEPFIVIKGYLPEVPVMLRKTRKRAQASRGAASEKSTDAQLALFVRERKDEYRLATFTEDIPPELLAFSQLGLHDQIIQASKDEQDARNGYFDRLTAIAQKRIIMRNILRVPQETRDKHDITIMVSGPRKQGRVVIEDNIDLSQYTVHVIFPAGPTKKAYLAEMRYALAGNPYMKLETGTIKYMPTRKDLIRLDAAVNAANPLVRSDEEDLYMKYHHTVAAIQFVDNQIKALRDMDLTRDERLRRTTILFMKKVPYILSFIENANMWQVQRPEFRQLYAVEPTNHRDTYDLVMHLLSDLNTKAFVTENVSPNERNVIQTGSPKRSPLYVEHLRIAKETFDSGFDESDINGAAAAVYDLLDLQSLAG